MKAIRYGTVSYLFYSLHAASRLVDTELFFVFDWRMAYRSACHRLDFARDMQFLATLENPNVAKMMALVEEEPVGAVFEYSQFGDLPAFLDSYRFRDGNDHVR